MATATCQRSPSAKPKFSSWALLDTPSTLRSPDPPKSHSQYRRRRPRGSRGRGRGRTHCSHSSKSHSQKPPSTPQASKTDSPSQDNPAPQSNTQAPPYMPNYGQNLPTAPSYVPIQNLGCMQQSMYNLHMLSSFTGMLLQNITIQYQSILSMLYQTNFSSAPLQMRQGYYM